MMVDNMYTITRRKQLVTAVGLAVIGLLGLQSTSDIDSNYDSRRQLQLDEESSIPTHQRTPRRVRRLSRNGPSPLSSDVADLSFIIKPVIGRAIQHIYEEESVTKLNPPVASASTQPYSGTQTGQPYRVLDGSASTNWKSNVVQNNVPQYLDIDLGIPEHIEKVEIQFAQAGNLNFELQSSSDNGVIWTTLETRNSFTDLSVTFTNGPYEPARYLRFYFTSGYTAIGTPSSPIDPSSPGYTTPSGPYYSVSFVNIWREKRVVRSPHQQDLEMCGSTAEAVKNKLIGRNGGSLIQLYENAEYFSANMSPAVAASMAADPCAYAVEPNYIVRARGARTTRRLGGGASEKNLDPQQENPVPPQEVPQDQHRRLGMPEFNLEDDKPGNWGLERISTRGKRNLKYIWINEGFGIDVYMFDTGIYPDHSDWIGRNVDHGIIGQTRLEEHFVCAGDESDYGAADDHGTFMASIAAGKKYGTARMSNIHPIQVLDPATGEGSLASILCGVEKLIQDGLDYNLAHTPRLMRAVINLSLGTNGRSDILDRIASDMTDLGYTVVIAAGDQGGNACHYSPTTPRAIRVGAVQDAGIYSGSNDKTSTSNYGECIDIWAPGELIEGATNTGEYDTTVMSGTSVAAAFATGTATMFLEEIFSSDTMPSDTTQSQYPGLAKSKMFARSERNVLGDIGHKSPDKILQTTTSMCQASSQCEAPLSCLYDGVCGQLSDYFSLKTPSAALLSGATTGGVLPRSASDSGATYGFALSTSGALLVSGLDTTGFNSLQMSEVEGYYEDAISQELDLPAGSIITVTSVDNNEYVQYEITVYGSSDAASEAAVNYIASTLSTQAALSSITNTVRILSQESSDPAMQESFSTTSAVSHLNYSEESQPYVPSLSSNDFNMCIALDASGSVCSPNPFSPQSCSNCASDCQTETSTDTCCANFATTVSFSSEVVKAVEVYNVTKEFSIVQWSSSAYASQALSSATDTKTYLSNQIDYSGGGTNTAAAIVKCQDLFASSPGRKNVILLVTDGVPTIPSGDPAALALAEADSAKLDGTLIIPFFIENNVPSSASDLMCSLSSNVCDSTSDGKVFSVASFDNMDATLAALIGFLE